MLTIKIRLTVFRKGTHVEPERSEGSTVYLRAAISHESLVTMVLYPSNKLKNFFVIPVKFTTNGILFFRQLKHAREGVSHGGLGLLARHRRRQRLKAMLEVLKSLKTLVHTVVHLPLITHLHV